MSAPLLNAEFRLKHGTDPDGWEVEIHGKFKLWELPKLKQLLDIYASMSEPHAPPPPSPQGPQ